MSAVFPIRRHEVQSQGDELLSQEQKGSLFRAIELPPRSYERPAQPRPPHQVYRRKWVIHVERKAKGKAITDKVKDMTQADFGRLEIDLAEVEMPGLMACHTEFGPSQPHKGARITGSLIETPTAFGATVCWCSCNIFSTQDHAAAVIARDSASVFAWKGETLAEFQIFLDIIAEGLKPKDP